MLSHLRLSLELKLKLSLAKKKHTIMNFRRLNWRNFDTWAIIWKEVVMIEVWAYTWKLTVNFITRNEFSKADRSFIRWSINVGKRNWINTYKTSGCVINQHLQVSFLKILSRRVHQFGNKILIKLASCRKTNSKRAGLHRENYKL